MDVGVVPKWLWFNRLLAWASRVSVCKCLYFSELIFASFLQLANSYSWAVSVHCFAAATDLTGSDTLF